MRTSALLVFMLGGCDVVFSLTAPPDGPIDAPSIDAFSCAMPASVSGGFDNPANPCEGLGNNVAMNSMTAATQSQLRVTPFPDVPVSAGGCNGTASEPFDTGVFIEISQFPSGPQEYMFFHANFDDNAGSHTLALAKFGSNVALFRDSSASLGMAALGDSTRWWRMRPREDGNATIGESSPDGRSWTVFATDDTPPPPRVRIEMAIGVFPIPAGTMEANPSTTIVEGINVCPP